jgi:hypothetical protein
MGSRWPKCSRKFEGAKKVREKRRQDKLAKQHRKRKDKRYNPRRYLTHNQKEGARRILEGEVTMVTSASWAFFERFLVFLNEVGFFEVIHIEGGKFYRKMMDVALLILTYQVKVLLGIASINQAPACSETALCCCSLAIPPTNWLPVSAVGGTTTNRSRCTRTPPG